MILTIDTASPILALLRSVKIRHDGPYRGELARFYERPGLRRHYFAAAGLSIDAISETLYDRGLTVDRPSEREVLDMLERVFAAVTSKKAKQRGVDGRALEQAYRKAQRNRWRRWTCSEGCSSVRASKEGLQVTCNVCGDPLVRRDPTSAEVTLSGGESYAF